MKNCYLRVIVSSLIAGLIMGLAGFELIAMEANNAFVAGAFIQGFGLLLVLFFNLELYNCHLCNVFTSKEKIKSIILIMISLVINILTIVGVTYLFRIASNEKQSFIDAANKFVDARVIAVNNEAGKPWYMAIITGFMCGLLCYIGGFVFKRSNNAFTKVISPILAVGIFVVCGFENVMTNASYIAYAQRWNLGTFLNLIMVFIGNTLGIIFTYYIIKLVDPIAKIKSKKK